MMEWPGTINDKPEDVLNLEAEIEKMMRDDGYEPPKIGEHPIVWVPKIVKWIKDLRFEAGRPTV
jgi:hypothetical protein